MGAARRSGAATARALAVATAAVVARFGEPSSGGRSCLGGLRDADQQEPLLEAAALAPLVRPEPLELAGGHPALAQDGLDTAAAYLPEIAAQRVI